MKIRSIILRACAGVAPLMAALALAAPPIQAAAPPIIVDTAGGIASSCGVYNGKPAVNDVVAAVGSAASGQTVVICPGTYNLSGFLTIANKDRVTIKAAVNDLSSRPILVVDPSELVGLNVYNSLNDVIDGLVIDGRGDSQNGYSGIFAQGSSVAIKNTGVIGPNIANSNGIYLIGFDDEPVRSMPITNTFVAGYQYCGVCVNEKIKLTVTSSQLDASDGGRVSTTNSEGVYISSAIGGQAAGSITKSRFLNNKIGIHIYGTSKLGVTGNVLVNNTFGVQISAQSGGTGADGNKVTGNTILEVPPSGYGVYVQDTDAANVSISKTAISSNIIAAGKYTPTGVAPIGVYVEANQLAITTVTATVSSNTFFGFPANYQVINFNGYALLTYKSNQSIP